MIKQLLTHEHCQRCQRCCRFTSDELYFAPLFSSLELETLRHGYPGDLPEFAPKGNSENVFQLKLKRAKYENSPFEYVCPFLDEENYACTIYDYRPFDCQQWPFVVAQEASGGKTMVVRAQDHFCKGLAEVSPEAIAAYGDEFVGAVTSGDKAEVLRAYPDLVWQLEPVHLADVVLVKEILPPE